MWEGNNSGMGTERWNWLREINVTICRMMLCTTIYYYHSVDKEGKVKSLHKVSLISRKRMMGLSVIRSLLSYCKAHASVIILSWYWLLLHAPLSNYPGWYNKLVTCSQACCWCPVCLFSTVPLKHTRSLPHLQHSACSKEQCQHLWLMYSPPMFSQSITRCLLHSLPLLMEPGINTHCMFIGVTLCVLCHSMEVIYLHSTVFFFFPVSLTTFK